MLVVELDGHSHDLRRAHDAARDRFMAEAGYKVLRFTNADVQGNVEGVATAPRPVWLTPDAIPRPSRSS